MPTVGDFEEVARNILEVASNQRAFKAAAFVGSLARGDINPRSDLDLILVAHDKKIVQARELERKFRRTSLARGIPLDSRLWSSSDACRGRHTYGPSYLQTLPTTLDQYAIGRPLAECFRVPGSSVQMEMLEKLEHKLHSTRTRAGIFLARHVSDPLMVEDWLMSNCSRVVRPMRVYVTVGRRLLWWLHGTLPNDGKTEVIAQFLSEETFLSLHAGFTQLVELDHYYDELLGRACTGSSRRSRYLHKVGELLRENFRVSLRLLSDAVSLIRGSSVCAA
ncbi:nucleotidyltransferase domain-containing protein [Patescibacteria group bacterium]|nr:MAG: nucleotidyltransferase domain-containing protein [Patescibacteria group bacterium]